MASRKPKPPGPPPDALDASVRVLVLVGEERFFRQAYTDRLRENIEHAGGAVAVHRFDGTQHELAEVLDECRSFGLLAGHKLVVVDNAEKFVEKDNRPAVERYAESPTEGCTLVLRCETWRKGNLDKLIAAAGGFIECPHPEPAKAAGWVVTRVTKRHGRSIDNEAAVALVERVGCELDRLAAETDKLVVAVAEGEAITSATVDEVVGKTREEQVWDIQRRLLEGRPEPAIAYLRELISTSRQPPTLVRWAIVDLVRKLHAISLAVHAGTPADAAAKPLRLWGPGAQHIKSAARSLRPESARALMRHAVDTDAAAKTGLGDEEIGLEALSLRVIDTLATPADTR